MKFGFFSLGHVPKPLDSDTWADGQEQVLPEFRDRDEAHRKWRDEQIADIPVPVSSTV